MMTKKQLESAYASLLCKAAKMRMQLMTLATDINSKASKSILAGYRKQILGACREKQVFI
jgi:hypothetical protein